MNHDASAAPDLQTGDIHDFDFLHGNWSVTNRRLRQRFVGSNDWDVFAGVQRVEPRLGGAANVDEINCPTRGFSGMTIRLFDRATRLWSIYWISSAGATLYPPVRGGFAGDTGTFEGSDEDDGIPVRVRFTWQKQGPLHARWSQHSRAMALAGKPTGSWSSPGPSEPRVTNSRRPLIMRPPESAGRIVHEW